MQVNMDLEMDVDMDLEMDLEMEMHMEMEMDGDMDLEMEMGEGFFRSAVWKVVNNDGPQYFLQRCPSCDRENYALNVAVGICTWCGYEASEKDINELLKGGKDG